MRRAVYAGTFDPVTLGHLSVIERTAQLFDELWVVVAVNPAKAPLFGVEARVEMIREVTARISSVRSASTDGYVVHLARRLGARYLVRGVRTCTDVESELALAHANHGHAPEVETVFVPAHPALSEVSSSKLKELAVSGADLSRYCPDEVATRLRAHLGAASTTRTEDFGV